MPSISGALTRFIRQFKGTYVLHNLLHARKLQHNKALYKKYGLRKSIYSPLGSQDFSQEQQDIPWLDQPNALKRLTSHPQFTDFSPEIQQELQRFVTDGYMILRGYFPQEDLDRANAEMEQLLGGKEVSFHYTGRKIMQSYQKSRVIDQQFFRKQELLTLLSFLMGKPVIPFQTINFREGSEQRAHSDSIHMTTQPPGYLIACWTALEPITEENGPLFYYPGSHRLPYITCPDYPSGNTAWTIGANSNERYEDAVEEVIEAHGLKPKIFRAEPGDMLIWHANLLHGGSAIAREGATRNSLVAHYFCADVICYHELSQRPALLDT